MVWCFFRFYQRHERLVGELVSCGALRHEAMAFDSASLGWVADTCQAKTSSAAMSGLDTQPCVEMRIGDFWRQPSGWH
jgi:hypothetical protein